MTSKVLRKKIKSPRNGTAVAFVVDDSSSMRGRRSKAAWKAASLLVCACNRAKFPVAIVRFNTRWAVCKNFSAPMARCRDEFSFGGGGGTDIIPAFNAAVDMLGSRREPRKILFVLTDGHTEPMTKKCQQARSGGIQVVPIMFGDQALGLTRSGGCWHRTGAVSIPDKDANTLPAALVNALAKHL
jgi:Mg-chelatase subunit ChlD